jgi:hypothetical protein
MKTAPIALAAVLFIAAASPALASAPAAWPAPAPVLSATDRAAPAAGGNQSVAAPAAEERLICRRQSSGSSRGPRQKVCLTKEQWRAQEQASGVSDLREDNGRLR